jgi:ATP-binding cassette subfamily F protein uup
MTSEVIEKKEISDAVAKPIASSLKLSYKEKRELESLPALIEKLENQEKDMLKSMENAHFYKQDAKSIAEQITILETTQRELQQAYDRWVELEEKIKLNQ